MAGKYIAGKKLGRNLTNWVLQGKTRVKFAFLLLSVIMWLLIKLSKPGYLGEVTVPVTYTNIPEDKVLLGASHRSLKLKLKANGFVLLKYKFLNFSKLKVNLRDLQVGEQKQGTWPTKKFNSEIESQFQEDVKLIRILPDTLRFQVSNLTEKEVLVKPQVKVDAASSRHLHKSPVTDPASVLVRGPRTKIKDISSIRTETWTVKANSKDTISRKLDLLLPELPHTSFSRQTVTGQVILAELTENTLQIPIQARNVPMGFQIELFPRQVAVTYQVALQDYDRIQASDFHAYVDFQEEVQTKEGALKIHLDEAPSLVRNTRLGSKRAEYIAMKP